MLLDANLLLYAVDRRSSFHDTIRTWLEETLNGATRIGLPWPSLLAFVRITTHARGSDSPLTPTDAWAYVTEWLSATVSWIPLPTERHAAVLGGLIEKHQLAGNLLPDGHLAALAIEHGLSVASADSDFAMFSEVDWINPLA